MSKQIFSAADQQYLWQGIEKLIAESQQHLSAVINGQPEGMTANDEETRLLIDCYQQRIKKLRSIQAKLPQLKNFIVDKSTAA